MSFKENSPSLTPLGVARVDHGIQKSTRSSINPKKTVKKKRCRYVPNPLEALFHTCPECGGDLRTHRRKQS